MYTIGIFFALGVLQLVSGIVVPVFRTADRGFLAAGSAAVVLLWAAQRRYAAREKVRELEHRSELQGYRERFARGQKLEALGRLAGGVAHDFNNLLSVILGNGDLLLSTLSVSDPNRGPVSEIVAASRTASNLTRQLLIFAREEPVKLRPIDINRAVEGLLPIVQRLAMPSIQVQARLQPALPPIKAEPSQIDQVLLNLIVNARDAMPDGGLLTVVTWRALGAMSASNGAWQDGVCLSVSDTGVGMDTETRTNIFQRFFTTKASGKGTGLGLATVYGAVSQAGGQIAVESELGKGTTIRITFPVASLEPEIGPTQNGACASAESTPTPTKW